MAGPTPREAVRSRVEHAFGAVLCDLFFGSATNVKTTNSHESRSLCHSSRPGIHNSLERLKKGGECAALFAVHVGRKGTRATATNSFCEIQNMLYKD
jgi:hypothetical protein